ncbi:MAG: membrane protein [Cyclobacteriaceae bacterium]|nr:MAG: membrane protein [Cyclobacteriaceae bacterium]
MVIHQPTTLLPSITIFGTIISLFLAFKTNESYNRWWEARILWGSMVNYSRSFSRQILNLVTPEIGTTAQTNEELTAIQKELIYRHLGYINALRIALRNQNSWEELDRFLGSDERKQITRYANIPTQLVNLQANRLKSLFNNTKNDFRYMQIDGTLNEFYNIQGGCERIKNTVFPRAYSYLTTVFTWLFAFSLIFSLYDELNWEILIMRVLVAYVFLTLEKISRGLKDPFENKVSDIPMTAICRTIEIDLREMLGEEDLPPPLKPDKGVLY